MARIERKSIAERRAQLLQLGVELFSDRTYDEISIDDIARAAGMSKGLLYHYFPSKRDFYVAVVRSAAEELLARTEGPKEPTLDNLRASLDKYFEFVEEHAKAYAMLLRGGVGTDPEVMDIVEETRQALIRRSLDVLGIAEPSPLLRTVFRGWIGFVEGTSLDWIDHGDLTKTELRELLAATLVSLLTAAGLPPA